jgi:hypothetical protein
MQEVSKRSEEQHNAYCVDSVFLITSAKRLLQRSLPQLTLDPAGRKATAGRKSRSLVR